ncbi:hypothetical protein PHYC_00020 [Phycisphaerales bacterium]|nr:hypothetical protein PHYC_00020 [Phycisphaerales bacterium]
MRGTFVAGFGACSAIFAAAAFGQPAPERVEWLKAHSMPFEFDDAGHGFKDLEPLKAWIGDARIVSLGEPTHGTRECFQFKHRLTEFLASEMGFTIFSIEASMPEACMLTDYVLGGEGDPRKLIAGMYFWTWNTEEVLDMVEWMRRFNAEEKAKGSGKRIIFTGFDMQEDKVAMRLATEFVAKVDAEYLPTLSEKYDKAASAEATAGPASGNGILVGTFPVDMAKGKKITFGGQIKTKGVGQFAGLWWRADGPKGPLAFNNMQGLAIRGDTDWKRHEFSLDIPAETININFGVLVVGGGTAWFDGLTLDIGNTSFRNPEMFDLDFEGEDHAGLTVTTPATRAWVVKEGAASGAQCLRVVTQAQAPVRADGVSKKDAVAIAEEVLKHLTDHEATYAEQVGKGAAADGVQHARVVVQCFRSEALMEGGDEMMADEWGRDASMAANVGWLLRRYPGEKIVLWAHNGHVGRSRWSQGSYLEKMFPGEMVVVGFATGRGQYQAIGNGGLTSHELLPPRDGTLEWHLDGMGLLRAIVDLRRAAEGDVASGWLREPVSFRLIGALAMPKEQFFPRTVADEFDLMVWQAETTRARPLGGR